jgi:hypothetical protein
MGKTSKAGARKTESDAVLSVDEKHRYRLDRTWDREKPVLVFIMLNPSTADAKTDDPTIRRCMSFADDLGCGGVSVYNLFSLRTPYPEELWRSTDRVRLEALAELLHGLATINYVDVVAAWGAAPKATERAERVKQALSESGVTTMCLGRTKSGAPRHPLYIRRGTPLVPLHNG